MCYLNQNVFENSVKTKQIEVLNLNNINYKLVISVLIIDELEFKSKQCVLSLFIIFSFFIKKDICSHK